MLNRKELFHRDLPSEEAKAAAASANNEVRQPAEPTSNNDTIFQRNARPRILSNDFMNTQSITSSNRRSIINEGPNNTHINLRTVNQNKDVCKTVKIIKGKSLTIKSEKEVMDGKYKDTKTGSNKDNNAKGCNDSNSSCDSNKQLKHTRDLAGADKNEKSKTLLPGSSCYQKRNEANIQNAQVKVVGSNNFNCLGPIKVTNNGNEPIDNQMLSQMFSNTDTNIDGKLDHKMPAVNDANHKKMFTL
jgi:hypothetical protein